MRKLTASRNRFQRKRIRYCFNLEVNQDANEWVVDIANRYGCKVIVNTAPYCKIFDEFLSKVYMVTPNEVEAEELTGVHVEDLESAHKAAEYFYKKGVEKVIITLGSRGVFVSSDGKEEIVPAFKVDAVDTTGAGDAFNGGMLGGIVERKQIYGKRFGLQTDWRRSRYKN